MKKALSLLAVCVTSAILGFAGLFYRDIYHSHLITYTMTATERVYDPIWAELAWLLLPMGFGGLLLSIFLISYIQETRHR